jgi:hypothetical protein
MKNVPAIVNLISGIILCVLFLLTVLYSLFNFRKRYKDSILSGMLSFGNVIALYPMIAFFAFMKSSDSDNHLAVDDMAVALFALLSTVWTIYAFFRLSKNVEE